MKTTAKKKEKNRTQKPNSLPLKTHYPLCVFIAFYLKSMEIKDACVGVFVCVELRVYVLLSCK